MTSEAVRGKRHRARLAVAGILAGVVLAGCGVSASSANDAAAAAGGTSAVEVRQFQFMPAELAVTVGTTVTWTNRDDILHTATSGETPGAPDGRFDGPMDGSGKSFSHTFEQPGRFPYYCSRHTSMTGTVVVQ